MRLDWDGWELVWGVVDPGSGIGLAFGGGPSSGGGINPCSDLSIQNTLSL